ncbi:MAG: cytochrome P450, partial [Chitinophagaceae bacterium]|nr:cytochrome P450 [Chitinophagaceae bacterium]
RDARFEASNLSAYMAEKEPYIFKNSSQCPFLSKTTSKWLMYLSGQEHRQIRVALGKAIFEYDYDRLIQEALEDTLRVYADKSSFDLVDLSMYFIHHILRAFMGLDESVTIEQVAEYSNQLARSQDLFITKQQYLTMNEHFCWGRSIFSETGFKSILKKHMGPLNLSDDDFYSLLSIMLMAFFETSKDNLSMSLLTLMEHPNWIAPLTTGDSAMIKALSEEFIRFNSPLQFTIRKNLEPYTLQGVEYPANTRFYLCVASANRDESVFVEPNTLRSDRLKNAHLGFGSGVHTCLGALVARKEMEIALPVLASFIQSYRLDETKDPVFARQIFMHTLQQAYVIRK